MKNLILTSLGGAVILFIWNFVSWMIIPLHNMTIHDLPGPILQEEAMIEAMISPGVYHYPGHMEGASVEEMVQAFDEGPVITMMNYVPGGVNPMAPTKFLLSFLLNLISVLLTFLLLSWSKIGNYWHRVWFVTIIGLIAGVTTHVAQGLWFAFPNFYTFVNVLDLIIGWFLIGLLGAAMLRSQLTTT